MQRGHLRVMTKGAGMRILLIEDDTKFAADIERMLKAARFNVYTTDLGEEGVDLAKLYDYDIILLDLELPDMSGYEVLRTLRAAKIQTPILIVSDDPDSDSKTKGLSLGADDYLTKPFHRDELVARIQAIVRRSKGAGTETLMEFIEGYLEATMQPVTTAEIRDALLEADIPTKHSSLNWALTNLNTAGRIRRVRRGVYARKRKRRPDEPASGPGPQYRPFGGKLAGIASPPKKKEVRKQADLHRRLKADADILAKSLRRVANRYPELANAAREYCDLLTAELNKVDVTGVWSVGGSLASFSQSYREQNLARTLAEPLEPEIVALLQNVVRQHGAFILGFGEGRDLVERADKFAVDIPRLKEMQATGAAMLDELTENRSLVNDVTRAMHRPIRDSATEFGWASSRVGYSAYLIVRNSVRTMIKFSIGENPNIGVILGFLAGGSSLAGDSNAEFVRTVVPVLQHQGSQLLAFFNHTPEMRAYVEWALEILERDQKDRES